MSWDLIERAVAFQCRWFNVNTDRVRMPDGEPVTYYNIDFHQPAVGVVAVSEKGVLLVQQYRYLIDHTSWAIPSGGVEANEPLKEAAKRELLEETGYEAHHIEPLISFRPSYGATNQLFHLFLAHNPTPSRAAFDTNEVLSVQWFSMAKVLEQIRAGAIVDGLSLPGLLLVCHDDARAE